MVPNYGHIQDSMKKVDIDNAVNGQAVGRTSRSV